MIADLRNKFTIISLKTSFYSVSSFCRFHLYDHSLYAIYSVLLVAMYQIQQYQRKKPLEILLL